MNLKGSFRTLLASYFEKPDPSRSAITAALGVITVGGVDWVVTPNVSLGALYVLPILIAAPVLRLKQLVLLALLCSGLHERFSPFAGQPGMVLRMLSAFCGFTAAGWLVSEICRSRRLVVEHAAAKEEEMQRRLSVEADFAAVIQTSPLAILLTDEEGCILRGNSSASALLTRGRGDCARR